MKNKILLLLLLFSCSAKADYIPPSLNRLILTADKIIYGEIICMDEDLVEIKILDCTDNNNDSFTFSKFRDWECGKRWQAYEVGQISLFFLKIKDHKYLPLGGGNEGELPVEGDQVYVHKSTISNGNTSSLFERSDRSVNDYGFSNPYNGYVFTFNELWHAVKTIKNCFTSGVSATGRLINIKQLCPAEDLASTSSKNNILGWALEELVHTSH